MTKIKFSLGLLAVVALFVSANVSRADDLAVLVERMRANQAELANVTGQMDTLTSQNERDLKESNLYFENFKQQEERKKSLIADFRVGADKRLKAASDMVEEWNSRCAENRVGKLSKPVYDACASSRAQVEPTVRGIREGVKRDADEYFHKHIAPIVDIQKRQKKAMDDIAERIKGRFKTWEPLKARSDALKVELGRIRAALVDGCKTARTPESLKHCHSVGWDGARRDLPPLTNIQSPSRVTPNR